MIDNLYLLYCTWKERKDMEWTHTLNQAIEYIEENLGEDINCEEVAAQVYLSSFHFQRAFYMLTGMTVGEYIRNRRLSIAGQELLIGNEKVIDVALRLGYETPESFSKAFSRFHGVSPSQVRKEGTILKSFNRLTIKISLEGGNSMEYKIVNKEAFEVVALVKLVDGDSSKGEIPKFWDEYYAKGYADKVCGAMGICFQEMNSEKKWRYGIGCEKECAKEIPDGFEVFTIPAYTWAIFTCTGAMPEAIQKMWGRIYSEWLPSAKYELIPDFDIEYYYEGDTSSANYKSEIWIPVKEK